MLLRTLVRDCLCLNWALPAASLPKPPSPLRYQVHSWQGQDHVFASAFLFHHEWVHLPTLPLLRVSYPQLNFRLYVLDDDGVPSVLFRRMLMPVWVVPGIRLLTGQPAAVARLDFPRPSESIGEESWTWRVDRGSVFEVRARQDSPFFGPGPRFGSWEKTVEYFHERPRGYTLGSGEQPRRIDASHPPVVVWPVKAEVGATGLLDEILPLADGVGSGWPALHSSWLCPEIPFAFDLGLVPKVEMAQSVPHPAASRAAM
jgi:uncharacterized protein YqjF (DUF2071 family)